MKNNDNENIFDITSKRSFDGATIIYAKMFMIGKLL